MLPVFSSRRAWLFLLLAVLGSLTFLPHRATRLYVVDYENVLGTSLELTLAAAKAAAVAANWPAAHSRIA